MFAKCSAAVFLLCAMLLGAQGQVVVPAYSAAYVPSVYPSVYSPYVAAAAYPTVWAWGSNKNKEADSQPRAFARPSALLNEQPKSA